MFLSISSSLWSQQDPHFTRYSFVTDMMYNPAAVARSGQPKLVVFYRDQWSGLKGAPRTPGLSFETPLSLNAGLGFNCFQDRIGFDNHFAFQTNYAYRIAVSSTYSLSIGLKAGVSVIHSDFSDLITPEPDKNDPVYIDGRRTIIPRVGMGFFIHSEKNYVGLGIPSIAAFVPENGIFLHDDGIFLSRHFYLTGGHVFDIPGSEFQIKPGVFIKYHPAAPVQADIITQLWYKDIWGTGLSYRTGDAVAVMLDISVIEGVVLSYAYDMTYSDFTNVGRNAHEIILSVSLSKRDRVIPSIHKFPNISRF
jgi:type IX secretion system PorP/SprF family membrane protein